MINLQIDGAWKQQWEDHLLYKSIRLYLLVNNLILNQDKGTITKENTQQEQKEMAEEQKKKKGQNQPLLLAQ